MIKVCLQCSNEFRARPSRVKIGKDKYCSKKCYSLSLVGKSFSSSKMFRKGQIPWNKGIQFSEESRHKMSISSKGKHKSPKTEFKKGQFTDEKHPQWKGNNVGYSGIHMWIKGKLGKALSCTFCGSENNIATRYGWANISREYKRDINDWISLCAKCHSKYDRDHKQNTYDRQTRKRITL